MTKTLDVIYCGDHWPNRAKENGSLLTDQAIRSIKSLRSNWNADLRVYFFHTKELPKEILNSFIELKVELIRCARSIEPEHLMANKILPIHLANSDRDQLFLDCDTIIHRPIPINREADILVSFDALFPLPIKIYEKAFKKRKLRPPSGIGYKSPAKRYYLDGDIKQFPAWNAGVHYLNKAIRKKFYETYLCAFRELFKEFRCGPYEFYIETLAFTTTVFELDLEVEYFEKGVNFICTPRADALAFWPKSKIIVEHYAGNTSAPLQFDDEQIICPWVSLNKESH